MDRMQNLHLSARKKRFYVWKSGNRPDDRNTKALNAMIGCNVIVLQSRRSPHRTYILGRHWDVTATRRQIHRGNAYECKSGLRRFAACGNNKGFSCMIAGHKFH